MVNTDGQSKHARRRPVVTQKVLDGIITATSFCLAGEIESAADEDQIKRADNWAREMRSWMRERGTWKETIS